MIFKVSATVVFTLFGILSSLAVWDLGFSWYGIVAIAAVLAAFFYELWIVGNKEEQYRIGVLKSIEGYRGENIKAPRNLMDAKNIVSILKEDREILADAYIELYNEKNIRCPHTVTHTVAGGEGYEGRIERCDDCGGQFRYGDGEFAVGGYESEPKSDGLYRPYGASWRYED